MNAIGTTTVRSHLTFIIKGSEQSHSQVADFQRRDSCRPRLLREEGGVTVSIRSYFTCDLYHILSSAVIKSR
jgi:hypothetical protein